MYGCNASWVIEQAVRKYNDLYPQRYDCRKWNKTSLSMHCVFCHYTALHCTCGVQRKYCSLWSTGESLQKYIISTHFMYYFTFSWYCRSILSYRGNKMQKAKHSTTLNSKNTAINHCNEYHYSIQVCSPHLEDYSVFWTCKDEY